MNDKRFSSTARVADLELIEPVTRSAVERIISDSKVLGFDMMVFETYRSQPRQQQLYAQGATQLQTVGVHHFGLACDIVKIVNGEPSWKGDFSFLGALARKHGLIWGGDWGRPGVVHSFVDAVHVQRCSLARQSSLFDGSWYPDALYDPYADQLISHVATGNIDHAASVVSKPPIADPLFTGDSTVAFARIAPPVSRFGIDTNVVLTTHAECLASTPIRVELVMAAVSFACRYLYNLSKAEATALNTAGIAVVSVFEGKADHLAYFTAEQATADARKSLSQAQKLEQPAGSPIYFAVDFDVRLVETAQIVQYFDVINRFFEAEQAQFAVGVYGSSYVLTSCLNAKVATYFWQSGSKAYSNGENGRAWRDGPNLRQVIPIPAETICKVNIDYNVSINGNEGGWLAGKPFPPTTDQT